MPEQNLPDTRWAKNEFSERLFDALTAAGGEGRFAGGCVRDALLHREVSDIDVATTVPPADVINALEAAGMKAVPTGLDHGTITAVLDGAHIEVTTLREDIETDGRHAVVKFTTDWAVDSSRRDFTVNALYADRDGKIYDFQGGLQDLANRRIRFIGDASERIHEDALRILRFYRFSAWYAQMPLNEAGHTACKTNRNLLANLSAERVSHEIMRLLEAPAPVAVVQDLVIDQILDGLLPPSLDLGLFARVVEIENELGLADALRRLFALVGREVDLSELATDRRLSGAEEARLLKMAKAPPLDHSMAQNEAHRIIYRAGCETFSEWAILAWAASNDERHHSAWEALYHQVDSYEPVTFPITGKDVMDAGVPEGSEVGRILGLLEEGWLEQDFKPGKTALLKKLAELVA